MCNQAKVEADKKLVSTWRTLRHHTREHKLSCDCSDCRNRRTYGGKVQYMVGYATEA